MTHELRTPDISRRTALAFVTIALLTGALLRSCGLRFGFPNPLARTDEEVIVDLGLGVLSDPNPHFFDWPTLFPYLTGGVYAALFAFERIAGGPMRSAAIAKTFFLAELHLVPRVLAAIAGSLSIAVLFGAARELLSRRIAAVAAALLAGTYLHVRDSHFGVTDVPATLAMLIALWAGLRCATKGATLRRVACAGFLGGVATSVKYNTALILLVPLIPIGAQVLENPRSLGSALGGLAVLALSFALAFLLGTPFALLDHSAFFAGISGIRSHLAGGHVVAARGWTYHALFTLRYGVGIPLMLCAIAGAVWLAVERPCAAALVLVFPASYYAVVGSGQTVFARYMLPVVPFICLTAAVCVDRIAAAGERLGNRHARDLILAAAAATIVFPTLMQSIAFDRLMERTDSRVLGAEWITSHFPDGATMYQTGFGAGHLRPMPAYKYLGYTFDERAGRFEFDRTEAEDMPDLIVLLESPLTAYSGVAGKIRAVVADRYELMTTIDGVPPSAPPHVVYDLEDAFYTPFAGLDRAVRPGPTVRVFQRKR
jgi:dolichyl-phosphate-mannose-protein mannosyltransferase